jgi:hypothetical protein
MHRNTSIGNYLCFQKQQYLKSVPLSPQNSLPSPNKFLGFDSLHKKKLFHAQGTRSPWNFSSCSHVYAHHLHIEFKVRVRFPSQHQHRLNSGSIPEFNTKCGFHSCIYDKKFYSKNKKIKNSEEQWLLLILKAGKIFKIQYSFFKQKINFLYTLMYTEYSMKFFLVFLNFFLTAAGSHSHSSGTLSQGEQ